jgi:hypothetical protein
VRSQAQRAVRGALAGGCTCFSMVARMRSPTSSLSMITLSLQRGAQALCFARCG